MRDGFPGKRRITGGFGEDETALQDCLRMQRKAFGGKFKFPAAFGHGRFDVGGQC